MSGAFKLIDHIADVLPGPKGKIFAVAASAAVVAGSTGFFVWDQRKKNEKERQDRMQARQDRIKSLQQQWVNEKSALKKEYNQFIQPNMLFFEEQRRRHGDDYPEKLFYDEDLKLTTYKRMQETGVFWDKVLEKYESSQLPNSQCHDALVSTAGSDVYLPSRQEDFFFGDRWRGMADHYRHVVEPVDSFNWYYREKNQKIPRQPGTHYVDKIETAEDEIRSKQKAKQEEKRHPRPSRYIKIQLLESIFGSQPECTLDKAMMYREILKHEPLPSWEELKSRKQEYAKAQFKKS